MKIRIEKGTDIIIKLRFGLKKSASCTHCNLFALGVPLSPAAEGGNPNISDKVFFSADNSSLGCI